MQWEGIRPSCSIAHFQPGLSQPLALPSEAKHTSTRHQFPVQGSCFRLGVQAAPPAPAGHPGVTTTLAAATSRCLVEPLLGTAPVQQGAPSSPRRLWQAALAARAGAGWSRQPRGQPSSLRFTCTDSTGRAQAAPGCAPHGVCGPPAPIPAPHGTHIAPVPAPSLFLPSPASGIGQSEDPRGFPTSPGQHRTGSVPPQDLSPSPEDEPPARSPRAQSWLVAPHRLLRTQIKTKSSI